MRDKNQLAAGAGDCDIQTPVIEYKTCPAGPDERQDHDLALSALESLHRIDGDTHARQHLPQQNNLRTEWRDNPNRFGRNTAISRK